MKNNTPDKKPVTGGFQPILFVVEDDTTLNFLIRKTLERLGFKTQNALTGAQAISELANCGEEVIVLLDYLLPDMNARQVITTLQEMKKELPFIVMTGHGDEKIAVEIMKLGVRDYIIKEPKFIENLPKIIRHVIASIEKEKELARVEKALRKSDAKYRELYENLIDAFVIVDMAGRFIEFNQLYCAMLGYSAEEIHGLTYIDLTPEKWRVFEKQIIENQVLKRGYSDVYEKEYRRKDGTVFPIELRTILLKDDAGNPSGMWGIIRDISKRKQAEENQKHLEEQLRQSQKLEAIGQLSSGVAHDFNNLLGGIMGHAELLKMGLNPESPLLRHPEVIISSCEKAADLTRQLLTFARKAPVEFQKIDLNAFLKQVVGLMDRTIDRRIEIVTNLPDKPAFISGDRNQLENALLNIAINARDAMSEGGHLCISSKTVDLSKAAFADEHYDVVEGPYARVSIADTGTGMSKEIKERIFEPFFTTKEVGKGTGLGLASVYGCVKQHNGYITVQSQVGKGTQFDLYFPISVSGGPVSGTKSGMLLQGTGNLLVVDDEPVYHEILAKIFSGLGYTVQCCAGGAEAVEWYREHRSTVDVVVLDMNMPKMSGLQCFKQLKVINPKVRAIVASGYGDNSDRAKLQEEGVRLFIQKPYKTAELSMKIAELVNAPRPPQGEAGILTGSEP